MSSPIKPGSTRDLIFKIRRKWDNAGLWGTLAAVFYRLADRLDRMKKRTPSSPPGTKRVFSFIEWVRFAVPGFLHYGNIQAMEYALTNMPPGKPVLEIGSYCGLSTVVLSYLLTKHGETAPLFTCDKWEFEDQELGTSLADSTVVTHDSYRLYIKDTFIRTLQTFAPHRLPFTIECFSDEFFQRWFENEKTTDVFDRPVTLGGMISFCYIDGNHTYAFAKRDFENADRALVPGGFILFDDSADDSDWEVNQLTREIASSQSEKQYELVSKNPNYLFRKK